MLDELSQLTGGTAYSAGGGSMSFSLPGGPTLVADTAAMPLGTSRAADGTLRILSGADGQDVTDRLRAGRLGGQLQVRDDEIVDRMADLDSFAADFATRANALTASAFDLQGAAGGALFVPDPPAVES